MNRWILVVALCGCGSKEAAPPAEVPNDHQLHRTNSKGRLQIAGKAVPLASQPTMEWIGLPMSGDIDVAIDIRHPYEPEKASGTIRISCPAGCQLGDDKTTLKPNTKNARAAAFAGEIRFGHLAFDRFTIAIDIEDGTATIETFEIVSKDLSLKATGTARLADALGRSRVDACLRFAPGPDLQDRQPITHAALMLTGAPRASDGMFNIHLTGKLDDMKKLGTICDGTTPPEPPPTRPAIVVGSGSDTSSPPDDPDLAQLVESAVEQTGDTTFEIGLAVFEKLLLNPTSLAKGMRVIPAMKDGKPEGFKLYAIRPASLYARLGLQNGDTITAIAGQPIDSIDKALELYRKLRDFKPGDRIDVDLVRRGKPLVLSYTLK